MLFHDLCPSNYTGSQIALGTGSPPLQHISPCISTEFNFHLTASAPFALTHHHTHIHIPTHVEYHFHVNLTIGSFTPHTSLFQSNSHFCEIQVPFNHFGSHCGRLKHFLSHSCMYLCILHQFHQNLTAGSFEAHWASLKCVKTRTLIGFDLPQFLPLSNTPCCISTCPCTVLHIRLDFHRHPTACSFTLLITTLLLLSHLLTNSTPPTTTLGVVTWRLGIVLRHCFWHLRPLQSVYHPGKGIKDNALKMWGVLEGVHMQKQPGTLMMICFQWGGPPITY